MAARIRMTKIGSLFGQLARGSSFVVAVPERFAATEDDARVFAYKQLRREHPAENPWEWQARAEQGRSET